jgi:glycerol-3-phosphate acyltransferase PlsY
LKPIAYRRRAGRLVVASGFGYLVGSILTADIATKAANRVRRQEVDLRAVGSGNPGAANAMANLGTVWGLGVLLGDIAKGATAGVGGRWIAGNAGSYAAATAAVAGHCFPAWSRFRGGKGVATSAGTTLAVFPAYVPVDVGVIGLSWVASRHATRATLAASALFVVAAAVWSWRQWPNLWGPKPTLGLPIYAALTTAMIAYRFASATAHKGDLPNGEETHVTEMPANA